MMIYDFRFWRVFPAVALALCVFAGEVSAAVVPLKVVGNQLVTVGGKPVHLRGVNVPSLEWTNDVTGEILKSVRVATRDWHANLIRLPLCQDRWFGKTPEQSDGGAGYRALVRQVVELCASNSAYVVLDLHWSDAGEWGKNIGQHNLPDTNSVAFWKDLASAFKNHPAVLFDLYNEPAHITWDQWYKGGPMIETDDRKHTTLSYVSVGMPELLGAIRSTGARNVVVAGGIDWAYRLEGVLQGRQLADPTGNGVVYAAHPYPHAYPGLGRETIPQWAARTEVFAAKLPVIILEFGSIERMWAFPKEWNMTDERWDREMIAVLEAHRWNWAAWCFHPTAWPCLISDWKYTPTPEFGRWVKEALMANTK
jgi:hypothetical protein